MKALILAALLCLALPAAAQEVAPLSARDAAVREFSKDVAALQSEVHQQSADFRMVEQGKFTQQQYASYAEDLLGDCLAKAQALAAKWKSNPYVRVTGFDVALSVTGPEVSVAFEFK